MACSGSASTSANRIFTPRNTQISPPDPRDRPYAGYLSATRALIHDTDRPAQRARHQPRRDRAGGTGRQVQNGFHDIIGDTENKGWHYQLRDEPAFEALAEKTFRSR